MPISGREMIKLFLKAGFHFDSQRGSHIKLKKKGFRAVIIPNHKELAFGTEYSLRKLLKSRQ
jgi:predicted RNA binding protein YcfA (HicA-like mRNA interferase family)